jgi:hypothetical protein
MEENINIKDELSKLTEALNNYILLSSHTIINIVNKLDEVNLKELILDIEYI